MATIIEHGVLWTITEQVADILVEQNIIVACDASHASDLLPADYPIYHAAHSGNECSIHGLHHAINEAQRSLP